MQSYRGRSTLVDAAEAVADATRAWPATTPNVVLAFSSTRQSPQAVRDALAARFPSSLIAGCTSTGEHLDGEHGRGSLVLAGLVTPHVRWTAETLHGLASFTPEQAQATVARAFKALDVDPAQLEPRELVALLFIDGLSRREEPVVAALSDALDGVPLVGGSAGDDLAFARTEVYGPAGVDSDAAVLLVGRGPPGFYRIVKHQHFATRPITLAVTRADPAARRVYELDGYPAAQAYARALGIPREHLDGDTTFLNPVMVTVQGQRFVRSVQTIHDDDSLTFYCAVDEGWVLDIAGHHDMVDALRGDLEQFTRGGRRPAFLLAFNCILRALEAEKRELHGALGALVRGAADASIGFDTYGETLDGLHINQTFVALGLDAVA
ncbi:MAG: FIST N-terminal domain-containing protein [Polyangiales bacterium]